MPKKKIRLFVMAYDDNGTLKYDLSQNAGNPNDGRLKTGNKPGDPPIIWSFYDEQLDVEFVMRDTTGTGLIFMDEPISVVIDGIASRCPDGNHVMEAGKFVDLLPNKKIFTYEIPNPGQAQINYIYALRIWDGNTVDPSKFYDPVIENGGGGNPIIEPSGWLVPVLGFISLIGLGFMAAYFAGALR